MIPLNRLASETSPYLQQHADNPVDWYPWGEEAFEKAKRENKPVLLSIGYSACHWCHVMAHESFSDQETAQIMNRLFVNIKVDREERPDLDKIYQTTHLLQTGNPGGWPLTVFLDPEQQIPFFSGTYFPKEPRYQLPSFKDLLNKISVAYHKHRQDIISKSQDLMTIFENLSGTFSNNAVILDIKPWSKAIQKLTSQYDAIHGGFGDSPKFPDPSKIELLLWDHLLSKEQETNSWEMAFDTLKSMARGGIYDHIGGGFYRYSIDNAWEIPHFEKMLYDNAQLLYEYSLANAIQANPIFKRVVTETASWVINEMQSLEGGYYSSIDADSEGKEGWFYLWSNEEVESLLTFQENEIALLYFNLYDDANFENLWHLHIVRSIEEVARKSCESLDTVNQLINSIKIKLNRARKLRIFPMRDEKLLTSWNALMIKGMLFSGIQFKQSEWIDSAERALSFICTTQWKNNRLLATYKDNKSRFSAYLDDYAFLLDAVLCYLQYCWNSQYFLLAQSLAEVLLEHFFDQEHGGFFFTADDHEKLIYRPKTLADEVIPSGNGIACLAIQRLGYLLGEQRYLNAVELTLKTFFPIISQYPSEHASLLQALQEYIIPPKLIILRGNNIKDMTQWRNALDQHFSLTRMIFAIDDEAAAIHSAFSSKKSDEKTVVAYICKGLQCLAPVTDIKELETLK